MIAGFIAEVHRFDAHFHYADKLIGLPVKINKAIGADGWYCGECEFLCKTPFDSGETTIYFYRVRLSNVGEMSAA